MTTPDQSKGDRSRDEVLAGEYVLGVLSAEDRKAIEARMARDRAFAAIVQRWEDNLSSFNEDYPPEVQVPVSYARIEGRIFGAPAKGAREWPIAKTGLWNSLRLWRGLALASFALMIVYAVSAIDLGAGRRAPLDMVADLGSQGGNIDLVAKYQRDTGRLFITPVAAGKPQEKSLELWMIVGNEPARSLGVLPQTGEGEIVIPADMRKRFGKDVTLAVSIEPFGGSPTGVATGPVIAAGKTRMP